MNTYTVVSGDTIYGISKQFGIPVDTIKKENNLQNNNIYVGQVLKIPTSGENFINYTVKKGDSLYSIAGRYNTTVNDIKKLNNLTSNLLSIGQILKIPKDEDVSDGKNYINYIIKRGDTLYSIAKEYDTTIDDIKNLNSLSSNNLTIGNILKIPTGSYSEDVETTPTYITYIVRKGDSLYSIAKKYNMSVDELKSLNDLKSNFIDVGQILKVIGSSLPSNGKIKECIGTGYVEPKYQTYTVNKGDSLYVIANKFNTSIDNIKKLNNLTSNNLQIGQLLKIKEI